MGNKGKLKQKTKRLRFLWRDTKLFNHLITCTKMSEDKSNAEDKKKTVDLGLLEEDDEFEEFPAEEWEKKDEDAGDVNVWEDNWDDDTIEDDFSVQLRSELQSQGVKMET